ncbi:carbonic anhydrase [Sulfuracidifex tepidarius]|uniref:Carbonic anhydrase n=1 Tax=Sulfuracidifex tepidarius TaxID=1294262 RepID=A0A510DU87_9CREN|nr:carbonic anhydrase [Sulfuracidifex tepidarius]BBG23727.1 hypothetical protein IC006_1018 [Sulfuracidifex tepidarius]BBG26481.1 hypothetical protein IC007_0992 [Sulfuracidifex tepidarius]
MKVVLSCMDYRLTEEVMKKMGEGVMVIRNAGANVNAVKETLRKLSPEEVIFMPHTDCAAMKLVKGVLTGEKTVDKEVEEKLVSQFKGKDVNDLDKVNAMLGEKLLKEILPNAKVTTELIDVGKIKWPERKAVYYLLKSSSKYENDMIGGYMLQAPSKEDLNADVKIADSLGLKLQKSEF